MEGCGKTCALGRLFGWLVRGWIEKGETNAHHIDGIDIYMCTQSKYLINISLNFEKDQL